MSPGRNDPCPCGSGKKYKRCCALQESIPAAGALAIPPDVHADLENISEEEFGERLMGALQGLRFLRDEAGTPHQGIPKNPETV